MKGAESKLDKLIRDEIVCYGASVSFDDIVGLQVILLVIIIIW